MMFKIKDVVYNSIGMLIFKQSLITRLCGCCHNFVIVTIVAAFVNWFSFLAALQLE